MINVYILCGGPSSEHDIALRSALNISNNLNENKYNIKIVYIDKKGAFSEPKEKIETKDEFDLVRDIKESKTKSISNFLDISGRLLDGLLQFP